MKKLKDLIPFLKPYLRPLIWGSLFALFSNAIAALGPWLLKLAIDALKSGITSAELAKFAGWFLLVAVASGVFRFAMRRILIGVSREVELDLRNALFSHLQRLQVNFFHRRRTGDLIARSTSDLDSVRNVLGPGIMYPVDTLAMAVFALAMMIWISPRLTLIALCAFPVVSISVFILGRVTHKLHMRIQEQYSALSDCAQENFSGVRVVRAFAQESREIDRFRELNEEYVRRNLAMVKVQAMFMPVMFFLFEVGTAVMLLIGGRAIFFDEITLGDFVAFVGYLGMLAWPMIAIGWVANLFQRGAASMGRIMEILNERPEITNPATLRRPEDMRGEIEFDRVSFSYGENEPVLKGISFRANAGTTVALIGRTGSGKSTIVNLIPRILDPINGAVRIDGVPTTEWPLAELRALVGMVPQDAMLFSDSLENNVAFGVNEVEPDRIAEAARIAQLSKDVEEFRDGYRTVVGERGITLSGGQKGRAALARALLRNPRILILDDALAAVDTNTEEEILRELRTFTHDRTSIIVSHRISAVREADLILVVDQGEIIERGTHEELVEQGGFYADLERMQRLERELESMVPEIDA